MLVRSLLKIACLGALGATACNGGDTDTDTDTSDQPLGTVFLSFDDVACETQNGVIRGVASVEDDHWAATRIDPGGPFTLTHVGVELLHDPSDSDLDCDASLQRDVMIYVASGDLPPNTGNPDATVTIEAEDPLGGARAITMELDDPLDVGGNQVVFVAVQMRATSTVATCIRTCDIGGSSDDNYWSNEDSTPFDWQSYSDIAGLDGVVHWMWIVGDPQ